MDISEIARHLNAQVDGLVPELLPGACRAGNEWTAGSLAGEAGTRLSVHRGAGSKQGLWKNFAANDEAGDMLDLVAATLYGGNKAEAVRWAKRRLCLDDAPLAPERRRAIQQQDQAARDQYDRQQADRAKTAAAIWYAADPLAGSPAEWYLMGRGIDIRALPRPPSVLRFAWDTYCAETKRPEPAMLAAMCDVVGRVRAVHRTYLTGQGTRWHKARLQRAKMVLGATAGLCIPLSRGSTGRPWSKAALGETLLLTEGIEDALSMALLRPQHRAAAVGTISGLARLQLPAGISRVIIGADNDPLTITRADGQVVEHPARVTLRSASQRLVRQGLDVAIARPDPAYKDFNAWLQAIAAADATTSNAGGAA